jgi:hypothetical protein
MSSTFRHTPEHLIFLLTDTRRRHIQSAPSPAASSSSAMGRPDLLERREVEGTMRAGAAQPTARSSAWSRAIRTTATVADMVQFGAAILGAVPRRR